FFIQPESDRIDGTLCDSVRWIDIWSPYDWVPLRDFELPDRSRNVYETKQKVAKRPESVPVLGRMGIFVDHSDYFTNDEQVNLRLAQEIHQPDHTKSRFF